MLHFQCLANALYSNAHSSVNPHHLLFVPHATNPHIIVDYHPTYWHNFTSLLLHYLFVAQYKLSIEIFMKPILLVFRLLLTTVSNMINIVGSIFKLLINEKPNYIYTFNIPFVIFHPIPFCLQYHHA